MSRKRTALVTAGIAAGAVAGRRDRAHRAERATPGRPRGRRAPVRAPARGSRTGAVVRRDRARRPRRWRPVQPDDRVRPRVQPRHDDLALPVDRPVRPLPVRPVRLPFARPEREGGRRRPLAARVRPRPRGGARGGRCPAGAAGRAQHGRDVDPGDGRDPARAVRGPGRGRGVRGLGRERPRPGRVRLGHRAASASSRFVAAGGRAREQAPAVRAVEPGRRRPTDRSRDAVRTRRLAPPRPLRGRARGAARPPRCGPTASRG